MFNLQWLQADLLTHSITQEMTDSREAKTNQKKQPDVPPFKAIWQDHFSLEIF